MDLLINNYGLEYMYVTSALKKDTNVTRPRTVPLELRILVSSVNTVACRESEV